MLQIAAFAAAALTAAGCAAPANRGGPADEAPTPPPLEEPASTPEASTSAPNDLGDPEHIDDIDSTVAYYIARLSDRDYVDVYGGENPRPWYIAAERLGQIGAPAIPSLVAQLSSDDEYELMLALYALMLASQDPGVLAATGGRYVALGTVLTPQTNAENRTIALEWWAEHRHLWE
jgi:hypothetical protein